MQSYFNIHFSDLKLSKNLDRHVWNMTWTDITTARC